MTLGLYEILKLASEQKSKQDKIAILNKYANSALATVLQYTFHKDVKFLLPEGEIKYHPNSLVDQQNILYTELRKLYLFIEGGHATLDQTKRESLFIQLLERVDREDALLLLAMKEKKLPFKNLSKELMEEAFPHLFLQQKAS